MGNTTKSSDIFLDPVCFMKIDRNRQHFNSVYEMRTYYFCAEACRKAFEANPDKYLAQKAPKPKGIWGRYLDRLTKETGGKAMKCH
jgi:YHS domain-containing protein